LIDSFSIQRQRASDQAGQNELALPRPFNERRQLPHKVIRDPNDLRFLVDTHQNIAPTHAGQRDLLHFQRLARPNQPDGFHKLFAVFHFLS